MPVEIKELLTKARVAVDWENQTITAVNKGEVFVKFPENKEIIFYVKRYIRKNNIKKILPDKSGLSAFLIEWNDSLPVFVIK